MTNTTPDGAVAGSSPGWGVRVGWSRPVEPASAVRRADGSPIGMSRYLRMRPVRASIPGETAARSESGPEGDSTHDDTPVTEIRAFVSSRQASSWLASRPTVKTDGPSPTWTAWSLSRFDSSTVLWGVPPMIRRRQSGGPNVLRPHGEKAVAEQVNTHAKGPTGGTVWSFPRDGDKRFPTKSGASVRRAGDHRGAGNAGPTLARRSGS